MEFTWGWQGKSNKQREKDSSDEDKNPKHWRRNWREVVKESPVAQGNAAASGTCHTQPSVTVPAPISSQLLTVRPNHLNPNEVHSGEQVIASVVAVLNTKPVINSGDTEGWTEHKSRRTVKNEKKQERKFSPQHNGNDGCWVCGKKCHTNAAI